MLDAAAETALERLRDEPELAALIRDGRIDTAVLEHVLACSEYAGDVLQRTPALLTEIAQDGRLERPLETGELERLLTDEVDSANGEDAFMRVLRRFRHRELVRIVWRDLAGHSDTAETLRELSALANACIRAAVRRASAELQARYGIPRSRDGETESEFVVIAMGKLGGAELNFSSDVDLVFLYTARGETDGERPIDNEDYFRRLAQQVIHYLSKQTADGFVYRVDARLRPFGDSGPLACSLGAFEDYLVQHGRDWERYAWVKARAVTDWDGTRAFYTSVLRPFVYRRYLDFGVFASLRAMKSLIEREGRAAGNVDNIKLGPGGIREIEFIVQTLQLVRGGTVRGLRTRSLITALRTLGEEGLMQAETVAELASAYTFLRDLENRLQAIADRQTHDLPKGEANRARLVRAMGFDDWESLIAALDSHRNAVLGHFDEILRHDRDDDANGEEPSGRRVLEAIAEEAFAEPDQVLARIDALRESSFFARMDDQGRLRLEQLLPAMLRACAALSRPLPALDGMLRVVEAIGRRSAYFALLNENPAALDRLVRVCGSSDFLARQVAAHPLLLDELLDSRLFSSVPTRASLEADLQDRLDAIDQGDPELCFEALRNFQHAAVFRVAVADLSEQLPLMKVSDRLTDTAELVLEAALRFARTELEARHGKPRCRVDGETREAGFAIAGYGKLGGLELGYGSDLDIVFVHDSAGEDQETDGDRPLDNSMFFGRLARRITSILTMPTPTGALYEVDTRLRPSGKSGLLVTSLAALDTYQGRDAWTWEHQALLRARAVAGDASVCEAFEQLRKHVLIHYVKRDTLRKEVMKMRKRMRAELSKGTDREFDLKQGDGGMIDIEFLVQYLVLQHAAEFPYLIEWSDNIRQLEALGKAGVLTPEEGETLAECYRAYRFQAHLLSLAGQARTVAIDRLGPEREQVSRLWNRFLGEG